MTIEKLAFKEFYELKDTPKIDLLLVIEFLQKDRKQWINQYSTAHNDYVELKEIEKEHQRINGELREEIKDYQKELEKADSITQSCIFNGKKESEISFRVALNELEKLKKENKELKDRIDKAVEYTEEHRIKNPYHYEYNCFMGNARASDLLEILKGDKE